MTSQRHPSVYQMNTRVLLHERGAALGRPATLDDVPEALLDDVARMGFSWVYLLGVWQTGEAARTISRSDAKLQASFSQELPGVRKEDIVGSPFAVVDWHVHEDFGGDAALARLRARMAQHGLRLLLDFVPNHVAPDHPWVRSHPEYFVAGTVEDLHREPQNYTRVQAGGGSRILAHGRDPYFDGWQDTLQLNYRHAGLQEAQLRVLAEIADRCDGVRCDMAMLIQPEVFQRTWGERARPSDGSPVDETAFWPAAISVIRRRWPAFVFVAEVYWDREWELQQAGFDYTYDKRLYDRLRAGPARDVRGHLQADAEFQRRSLRFLENHDEPRAAAVFDDAAHRAAAVITYLVPGMRFFHEGQLDGRKVHVSMHLRRRPRETVSPTIHDFYRRLLGILRRSEVHDGRWTLCESRAAWAGNPTHDQFVAMTWTAGARVILAVSNYGPSRGQCYLDLDLADLAGRRCSFVDLLGDARYDRDVGSSGLYLDMPPWGCHVFEVERR